MLDMKQVTIIGTGLLGASLALALRDRGFSGRIVGVGRREKTLEEARELGCFDGLTTSTAEALAEGRSEGAPGVGHMAVLAAPLGHFEEIFTKVAAADDPGLVITDVGSTKASVCAMARALLPDASRFVGSHPMAGSEQQGPTAADGKLFEGKPCVVTPMSDTDQWALDSVRALWESVGMNLLEMDPGKHDRCVALVSHLPHAVSAMLVNVVTEDGGDAYAVASTGFASMTRIASGDPGVWVDIFQTNRDAVIDSVDKMMEELARFRQVVAGDDAVALNKLLTDAKQERDAWSRRRREQG